MFLALTCQSGLESLVRRESEKLGLEKVSVRDRIISGEGDMSTLMRLCMGSRFTNRVYRVISDTRITDFDTLFTLVRSEKWDEYFFPDTQIVVDAVSTRSTLTSIPKIQSVIEKAIHESMNA
jgi:putative N6-adenine-specific DNA methylase